MTLTSNREDETIGLERTRIDDHLQAAALTLPLGGLVTLVYFAGFSRFGASELPWKITASATFLAITVLVCHYFLNRRARRLIWEGVAAMFAFGGLVFSNAVGSFRGSQPPQAPLWIIAATGVPPQNPRRSRSRVRAPALPALQAAAVPALPPPQTITSKSRPSSLLRLKGVL